MKDRAEMTDENQMEARRGQCFKKKGVDRFFEYKLEVSQDDAQEILINFCNKEIMEKNQ